MTEHARDRLDGLICQYPKCRHVIRALTGLQEIQKLQSHVAKKHGVHLRMDVALEKRAAWESGAREPNPGALARKIKVED